MNILQLSLHCAPNWSHGGPPRIMYDYANGLAKIGHKVTILTPESNSPKPSEKWAGFSEGVKVIYIKKYNDWRQSFYFDFSFREIFHYISQNRHEIDVIHLPHTRSLLNVVALRAYKKFNIPFALSSFGSLPSRAGFVKYFYDKIFTYSMIQNSALLLGQTENELAVYSEFGGNSEAIKLLPLAVNENSRPTIGIRTKDEFCEKYNIPKHNRIVLFLGRLHPTKAVPHLVRAFLQVHQKYENATLIIVGNDEGSQDEVMSLSIANGKVDAIKLCGPLYDNERWFAYDIADLYVISPVIFEETPLAAIEALSSGTPVITNYKADVPWLEQYQAGKVIKTDDVDVLAKAISQLITLPTIELNTIKNNAIKLFKDKFEIKKVVEQLEVYFLAIEEQ